MSDFERIEALERRLLNAWPSLECQFYRGWVARFANGYTKRANSVSPLRHGASLSEELVEHITGQFRQMHIRPSFRLTGLEKPGTDGMLAALGFVEHEPAYCMINGNLAAFEAEDAISISTDLPEQWLLDTVHSQGEGDEATTVMREIVSRIRQTHGFATLVMDEQPVAWGLGVVERGYIGLYDIVVQPDLRGLGLGRRVLSGLIAWGRELGATQAYLQVREGNAVARALYVSLGFTDAYRYHYRIREEQPKEVPDFEWNIPVAG